MIHTDAFKGLPACLSDLMTQPRWVGWKWVQRDGKLTKPPMRAGGGFAHNNKPETWATYGEVEGAAERHGFLGVGLQLLDLKGFAALDLDKVRDKDTGAILYPWAERLVACGSYAEITPSGTGFRVLGRIPDTFRSIHRKWDHPEGGEIEIYANTDTGRYITVTGNRVPDAPDALNDLEDEITGIIGLVGAPLSQRAAANVQPPKDWTPPAGGDRSGTFQSAVNRMRSAGMTLEQAIEALRADPVGTGAGKYLEPRDRLASELVRSWNKAGDRDRDDGLDLNPDAIDLSQDALALDMGAKGWNRDARYVARWGKWLFWDGTRWKIDDRREDMTRTRDYLRGRASALIQWARKKVQSDGLGGKDAQKLMEWAEDQARTLRHKTTVANIENLAQSNPGSAAGSDDFDQDLLLLGTPGGTLDLRTGNLRPARREDMLTKHTAFAPAPPGAQPLLWVRFLLEIFDGDMELVRFMQRAAGYALTGLTTEHKLLFLYGTGRNGKSVFLNVLFKLWGDYARKAAAETFLNSQNERHPTDVAGLNGARLVVGSELPRGKTWDESVIKDLTGGDKMTARFMRQDFFDFDPQLTLMIAGNTQPSFRGVDEAIRARVVLVPFTVTIPPEKRDTRLTEKLMEEGPAILRWCIDGALEWQRTGLAVPHSVAAASAEYFDAEDTVGQFLGDETMPVVGHFETSLAIHQRFETWCMRQGLQAWTQTTLMKELRTRGFTDHKGRQGRGLKGLKLL